MYTSTVQIMLKDGTATETHHSVNRCSQCSKAVWMLTANATYENSGSMQDYMKFLMSNAEERGNSSIHYRCYCTVLHEYNNFDWYDENYTPHIISECDAFVEYTGETEKATNSGPEKRMIQRSDDTQPGDALKSQW